MNKLFSRFYLCTVISLFFTLFSCSLNATRDTLVLENMDKTLFESMLKDKYWGNKETCSSSDICVHFQVDQGNSGTITLKRGSGQHIPVGNWRWIDTLTTKGTFYAKNSAGISGGYITSYNPLKISIKIEYQGQELHLVK